MKHPLFPIVFGFLLFASPGQSADRSPIPSRQNLVIGQIFVDSKNVFNPPEGKTAPWPYSWGNKLHIVTKEPFIKSQLLFKPGDSFDENVIEESERVLRRQGIFRFVNISPRPPYGNVVDIDISTEDVWTTSVQASYRSVGGKNLYSFGVFENNFLGHNVKLGAFARQDIDRFIKGMSYDDPRLLGGPLQLFGGYGSDEKGREYEVRFGDFYQSVLDDYEAGAIILSKDDEGRLFENGQEVATFRQNTHKLRAAAGLAFNQTPSEVDRLHLAYGFVQEKFDDPVFLLPFEQPQDRIVSSVMLGYESRALQYDKRRSVLTFDRVEDFNFGWEFGAEAGPSLKSLGATRDGAVYDVNLKKVWDLPHKHIWFTQGRWNGRYEDGQFKNSLLQVLTHNTVRDWYKNNIASLSGNLQWGENLDAEKQLLLGAENGLRGYSVRQFSGSKSMLITLENRSLIMYDWLQLVHIGWAVFVDAGGVWKDNQSVSTNEVKADAGAGIRLAPSRSTNPGIIRFDLAYAFSENNRSSRWVVNIGGQVFFGAAEERKFDF